MDFSEVSEVLSETLSEAAHPECDGNSLDVGGGGRIRILKVGRGWALFCPTFLSVKKSCVFCLV